MNSTKCLDCGTISEGDVCNECGGFNIPAPYYDKRGTCLCKKCGALYQYKVRICGMCLTNMIKEGS
jgi:RNA polymerase subunit RPABC4/transcription elongation factor Spt4